MYGVVTRTEPETEWSEFDRAFYEVKDVTGRASEPVESAVNMVSCFGDTAAVEAEPSLAAVDADGTPATREEPYFDWSSVCPTQEQYREGVLATIEDCAAENEDVRLDDVGFPRQGYCRCSRCRSQFDASDHESWAAWRAATITDFLRAADERIPGRTILTVYPDPFPGHLLARSGVDLHALTEGASGGVEGTEEGTEKSTERSAEKATEDDGREPIVDEVVVPLYDTAYGTTYWLEALASGFADRLDVPLSVELYAVDVDVDALIGAATVAEAYADSVLFGYDASNARAAIRRTTADARDGVTHE